MLKGKRRHVLLWGLVLSLLGACADKDEEPADPCDAGQTQCDGICVDTDTNPLHCGACGAACEEGALCEAGRCVTRCTEALEACAGGCVDTRSDAANCGGCGVACDAGEVCEGGTCLPACGAEELRCGGACVDPASDDSHCGACDNPCDEGFACVDGTCGCAEGMLCEGSCVDTQSDAAHCGGCGVACGADEHCVAGSCKCVDGLIACGGICVDPTASLAHCGGCDQACGGQAQSTGGVCSADGCELQCEAGYGDCDGVRDNGCEAAFATDDSNCGACGFRCSEQDGVKSSIGCALGRCQFECVDGRGDCDADHSNGCETDTNSTVEHCGACNSNCRSLPHVQEVRCGEGACEIVSCLEGFHDCNGDPTDGCETNVMEDAENCGTCNNICEVACEAGGCVLPVEVKVGNRHSCARLSNGEVHCWGDNSGGAVGVAGLPNSSSPVKVQGVKGATALDLGDSHTCAIAGGQVLCWGMNTVGQLGDDSTTKRETPVPAFELPPAVEVAAGADHTCALTEEGEVWCWGWNNNLQLGTTEGNMSKVPLKVSGLVGFQNLRGLSANGNHTCVVATTEQLPSGQVLCWGDGDSGQLGYGKTEDSAAPVGPTSPFDEVRAGRFHTCARRPVEWGGQVFCWGSNLSGQIGGNIPTQVQTLTSEVPVAYGGAVVALNSGWASSCLIGHDGDVWCWGSNLFEIFGEPLGEPYGPPFVAPVEVESFSGVMKQISSANGHACGITQDDRLLCWGYNYYGQVGNGVFGQSDPVSPTPVAW